MKFLASITALILSACAYASTGVAVPPPSDFVDTEAATNVDAQALTEAFRHGCFAVGLTGLGMVFLVVVGIWLCRQACRLHASCQGQPVFRRLALLALVVLAFTVGGTKTNGVNSLPPQQRTLPQLQPMVLPWPSAPRLQGSLPAAGLEQIAPWTRTGAYSNEFVIDFPEGWRFPYETNHLESVALVARGEVFASEQAEDPLAALTTLLSVKPGTSEVVHGPTTNNSYRIEWHDGSRSRMVFDPADAAIELFRNGDIEITENGVATRTPRTLPFAHDGYGQDAEWVAANFTNATEIAAAGGYPQWVDQQVGEGLTNGLYKLTVTVPDDPPETTQIMVGALSIAVTNAGEYAFLLEKGPAYALRFFPFSTNITVSAVDDIPALRSPPRRRSAAAWGDGIWTAENGEFVCNYYSESESGECWWLPLLVASPDIAHIAPDSPDATFTALVLDCAHPEDATFEWKVCDGLVAATPYAQSTVVTAEEFPSWRRVWMAVEARFGPFDWLTSSLDFTIGTNAVPQAGVALTIPRVMFVNDDDDDDDGTNDYEVVRFDSPEDDVVRGTVKFNSDDFTNGIIRVAIEGFSGDVYTNKDEFALPPETFDVPIEYDSYRTIDLYFNPYFQSAYQKGSVTAVWIPENGDPQTSSVPFTVVKPIAEPICSETAEHAVLGTAPVGFFENEDRLAAPIHQ